MKQKIFIIFNFQYVAPIVKVDECPQKQGLQKLAD